MPIRVVHVIDHLRCGGAQMSTKHLVENLADGTFEPSVCVLSDSAVEVPIESPAAFLHCRRWDPRTICRLARLCRRQHADIVHPHLHKSIISSLAATFFCEARVVVHLRSGLSTKGHVTALFRVLLRLLRRRAAVFIANSAATAEGLVRRAKVDPGAIRVLSNPIDLPAFVRRPGVREAVRAEWGAGEGDLVVGYLGRLHEVKGVDLLIQAFALLTARRPHLRLVLVGDGPQRRQLEALVQRLALAGSVRFLGMREDVAEVLHGFDVGVVPSRSETFGRVAVEMMRMGIPIVSSGADGLAELVRDGLTGLVTPENTPQRIAEAVERLVEDPPLCRQLTQRAYAFSEQFGIEAHVAAVRRIYQDVLAGRIDPKRS